MQAFFPPTSPPADTPEIRLGRDLFFENRLSADGRISCAGCHLPEHGFGGNTPVASGVYGRQGRRNSPPLLHLSQAQPPFFWDGRADSLEQQALVPLADPVEMGMELQQIPRVLSEAGYGPRFQKVYGRPIDLAAVSAALAAYQRTLAPSPPASTASCSATRRL